MNVTPVTGRRQEAGYTLLIAVFLVATMLILAAAAAPSILTEGRREKEAEMIWRGQQYSRAIGLYYKKFGKYPTKVEDLTRETNGVRFLRQAYKDPMNKDDGSWRFIYVGPNGQLIGSVKQVSLLQNSLGSSFGGGNIFGGGMQQPTAPGQGTANAPGGAPGAAGATGAPGQTTTSAFGADTLDAQPQSLGGNIIGGNIIGVGSKIKKSSLRVYLGGDTYQQWEFVFNPIGQLAVPGQTPANPNGAPAAAPNGAAPTGAPVLGPDGQPIQNPQAPVVNVPPVAPTTQ